MGAGRKLLVLLGVILLVLGFYELIPNVDILKNNIPSSFYSFQIPFPSSLSFLTEMYPSVGMFVAGLVFLIGAKVTGGGGGAKMPKLEMPKEEEVKPQMTMEAESPKVEETPMPAVQESTSEETPEESPMPAEEEHLEMESTPSSSMSAEEERAEPEESTEESSSEMMPEEEPAAEERVIGERRPRAHHAKRKRSRR